MTTISLNSELARMRTQEGPKEALEYAGGTGGAFRITSLFQKGLKTLGLSGYSNKETVRIQGDLGTAGSVLGLLDIPRSIVEAKETLSNLGDNSMSLTRRVAKAAADCFTAIATLGFGVVYLTGMGWLLAPVRLIDTASDAAELQINASNFSHVAEIEGKAPSEAKEAIAHSKKFYMLKTIIKATSVGLSLIGFALWATGVTFVSGLTLSIVSLALTAAAIKADLYKDPRKLLKCDRTIVV